MSTIPSGYVPLHQGGAHAIVRADAAEALHRALSEGTLHDFAASVPGRRELQGRGVAYAVPLMPGLRVVVRHNRHGGFLARLTGDRFLAPTRAPVELEASLRLAAAGVPTPSVIATVRYPAGSIFERADVATEEVTGALDLAALMRGHPELHEAAALAVAHLLDALADAGAHHEDLNLKNVLVSGGCGPLEAWVLDVDRVTFASPGSRQVRNRNWKRFTRSARKWRARWGAPVSEEWLERVAAASGNGRHR